MRFQRLFMLHKKALLLLGGLVVAGVFGDILITFAASLGQVAESAASGVGDFITPGIVNVIILPLDRLLAGSLVVMSNIMVYAAQYNDFVNAPAVEKGWVIVRDLSNMFFIVILLVIAFGTILRIQQYRFQQTLPRFIIWAVLINFSKFIAGVWIDFAQVIMLTFVNAFRDAAAGNIVDAFGLREMLTFLKDDTGFNTTDFADVFGAAVLSLALLLIANIVIISVVITFLFRIIALWLLVVLSPIAYLTRTFPNATKYSDQWWTQFNKYVMAGPVLAFFIWLALTIVATPGPDQQPYLQSIVGKIVPAGEEGSVLTTPTEGTAARLTITISEISRSDRLLSFILSIGLFIAALMATQQLGVMGAGFAGSSLQNIQRGALGTARWIARRPLVLGAYGARKLKAGKVPGLGGMRGIELNPANIIKKFKQTRQDNALREELAGDAAAGKRLEKGGWKGALTGAGAEGWSDYFGVTGFKRLLLPKKWGGGVGGDRAAKSLRAKSEAAKEEAARFDAGKAFDNPAEYAHDRLEADVAAKEAERKEIDDYLNFPATVARRLEELNAEADGDGATEDRKKEIKVEKVGLQKDLKSWEEEKKNESGEYMEYQYRGVRVQKELADAHARLQAFEALPEGSQEREQAGIRYLNERLQAKQEEIKRVENGGITNDKRKEYVQQDEQSKALLYGIERELERQTAIIEREGQTGGDRVKAQEARKEREKLLERQARERERLAELQTALAQNTYTKKDAAEAAKIDPKTGKNGFQVTLESLEKQQKMLELATHEVDADGHVNLKKKRTGMRSEQEKAAMQARLEEEQRNAKNFGRQADRVVSMLPQAYEARAAERAAISMESRKIDTSNEDELIALFRNAVEEQNPALAKAIAMQAAAVGHGNEIVNYAGEHEYASEQEGLNAFIQENFIKRLKLQDQDAFNFQSDLSSILEKVNHWGMGQSVGYKDGAFYQRSAAEAGVRQTIEMSKRDPEGIVRQSNRLAYGGEVPNAKGGRDFHISESGLMMVGASWKNINAQFGRGRFNRSAAVNLVEPEAMEKLMRLSYTSVVAPEDRTAYRQFLRDLKKYAAGSADQVASRSREASKILGHAVDIITDIRNL